MYDYIYNRTIYFIGAKNMYIFLSDSMINKFFGGMDSDCIEQVKELVDQGAVLNLNDGNLYLGNTNQHIGTDYFSSAWYYERDDYSVGDQTVIIATHPSDADQDFIKIECSPVGSDGWDLAQMYNNTTDECFGSDFRVYQLQIETFDGEWDSYPIWFESRDDATIYFNE